MNIRTLIPVFLVMMLLPLSGIAESRLENWYLPNTLNDTNSKITFTLDSTWHTVHGKTSKISGSAALTTPENPSSIVVNLTIPVANFDTDNESRDEELRDIMNEKEFPNVTFSGNGIKGACTPTETQRLGTCKDVLLSELSIRDVKKKMEIPIEIKHDEQGFHVSGSVPIKWEEFNVEDPSIFLIASVDPVVVVNFNFNIKK